MIASAKKIWDRLRQKRVDAKERSLLVDELFRVIKGHVHEIVFKHDASRIIQTAIKYGTPAQRSMLMEELKGNIVELSKSSYGKFLTVKLLFYGTPEMKLQVYQELHGHVRKLIRHKEAAYVLEDAFRDYGNASQKAGLIQEFYGPEFAIFQSAEKPKSLEQILKESPEKRNPIMKNLWENISASINKGSIGFTIIHRALLEYIRQANDTEMQECIETIREQIAEIVHTKDGSEAAMLCLARASAKDRKLMLKSLKPYLTTAATDEFGNVVIIAAMETVDDTVLVSKVLLSETKPKMIEMMADKFGRRPFLYALVGRDKRFFQKHITQQLEQVDAAKQKTSKKDNESRRSELVKLVSPVLLDQIASSARELLTGSLSSQLVVETLFNAQGSKDEAIRAIVSAVDGDPSSASHLLQHAHVSRALKSLVQNGHWNKEKNEIERNILPHFHITAYPIVISPDLEFATRLMPVVTGYPGPWATGDGAFVVANMLARLEGGDNESLKKSLRKHLTDIKRAAKDNGNKGAHLVLEQLS